MPAVYYQNIVEDTWYLAWYFMYIFDNEIMLQNI